MYTKEDMDGPGGEFDDAKSEHFSEKWDSITFFRKKLLTTILISLNEDEQYTFALQTRTRKRWL